MKKLTINLLIVLFIVSALILAPVKVFAVENVVNISSATDLANAIKNQAANQTWKIAAGTYNLGETELAVYADIIPENAGQGGWYFPITADGITIEGEGQVEITSSVQRPNGAWADQDFISVWSDDVSISSINIICKEEVNKAIEVMGKNFTLKDVNVEKVNGEGSGSIYFNACNNDGNIGKASLENVTLYSWVTASNEVNKTGTLTTNNVTIDFTDNEYAGDTDYLPLVKANNSINLDNKNFTLKVDDKINLTGQVFNDQLPKNTTVVLESDVEVGKMLDIKQNNVTLNLNGHTLTASKDFVSTDDNDSHLLQIQGDYATVKNGSVVTTDKNKYGINVNEAKNATLDNLSIDHTNATKGAPILINASSVFVKGNLKLTLGENSLYGIKVDGKGQTSELVFEEGSKVTQNGSKEIPVIVVDGDNRGNVTIKGAQKAGLTTDVNGAYVVDNTPPTLETPASLEQKPADGGEKDITPKTGVKNYSVIVSILSLLSLAGSVITKKYIK